MGGFNLRDFLYFDKLIAPTIIRFVYWVGLIGIGLGSLVALFGALMAFQAGFGTGLLGLLAVILGVVMGTLFFRIIMEIYTVAFGIHDRLGEIRDRLPPR